MIVSIQTLIISMAMAMALALAMAIEIINVWIDTSFFYIEIINFRINIILEIDRSISKMINF